MRWSLCAVSTVCLAALLLTFVFWPLSYWRSDVILTTLGPGGPHVNVRNVLGSIVISVIDDPSFPPKPRGPFWHDELPQSVWFTLVADGREPIDFAGMTVRMNDWSRQSPPRRRDMLIIVRFYLIAIVTLIGATPALLAIRHWRRERRRRAVGRCRGCGYDLRASPERCPECGRPNDAIGLTPGAGGPSSAT